MASLSRFSSAASALRRSTSGCCEDAHADRAEVPLAENGKTPASRSEVLPRPERAVEHERLVTRRARGDTSGDVLLAACEREVIVFLEVVQVAVGSRTPADDRCQDGHVRDSWTLSATASRNPRASSAATGRCNRPSRHPRCSNRGARRTSAPGSGRSREARGSGAGSSRSRGDDAEIEKGAARRSCGTGRHLRGETHHPIEQQLLIPLGQNERIALAVDAAHVDDQRLVAVIRRLSDRRCAARGNRLCAFVKASVAGRRNRRRSCRARSTRRSG